MTRENPGTILNGNDVESIQVLKDAASASIYGAQAANGVIIITTRRAKGECRVTFDATLTLQTYQSGLNMMNADQWGETYWSAYKYAYGTTPTSELYGNGPTPKLQPYLNLNGVTVNPGIPAGRMKSTAQPSCRPTASVWQKERRTAPRLSR